MATTDVRLKAGTDEWFDVLKYGQSWLFWNGHRNVTDRSDLTLRALRRYYPGKIAGFIRDGCPSGL